MNKPLVTFDLEATGVEVATARIVEFAALKVFEDGRQEKLQLLIHPECKIPNSDIHGITDEMVENCAPFAHVADKIFEFMDGCDLCGFNCLKYDVPLLAQEFARISIPWGISGRKVVDPYILFKILNPSNLGAVYAKYTGSEIDGAHRAMADVEATKVILDLMMERSEVPLDRNELITFQLNGKEDNMVDLAGKFIRNKDGVVVFNFGKHVGQPITKHKDFLQWMVGKDFTADTLSVVNGVLNDGGLF